MPVWFVRLISTSSFSLADCTACWKASMFRDCGGLVLNSSLWWGTFSDFILLIFMPLSPFLGLASDYNFFLTCSDGTSLLSTIRSCWSLAISTSSSTTGDNLLLLRLSSLADVCFIGALRFFWGLTKLVDFITLGLLPLCWVFRGCFSARRPVDANGSISRAELTLFSILRVLVENLIDDFGIIAVLGSIGVL